MGWKGRDIISIRDFSKKEILSVISRAKKMDKSPKPTLKGKKLATLFYEPSTRTRLSFETAMHGLGGSVLGFSSKEGTSVQKGESLSDTINVMSGYSDTIVLRHPVEGSARLAAEISKKPILNGGDGANQHPTQTFLDLFCISKYLKGLNGLKVGLVGDLKYGRTTHSLSIGLSHFGCSLRMISPKNLQMPDHIVQEVNDRVDVEQTTDLKVKDLDVLYMTRIQKERFPDIEEYEKVRGAYVLNRQRASEVKGIIMHPLPRVDEIAPDVDSLRQAKYFEQSAGGVPTRMALLEMVMKG